MIISINDIEVFKQKALKWANSFEICCVLDSNQYQDPYSRFDFLIAAKAEHQIELRNSASAFDDLETFRKENAGWVFGGLGYDLKNEIEDLKSDNLDHLNFPDLFFFAPKHLLFLKGNQLEINSSETEEIWKNINNIVLDEDIQSTKLNIQSRFSKADYLDTVEHIKNEIGRGNIYETNFCMEFFAEDAMINPPHVFKELNSASPTPFANYFKWFDRYVLSATPERFLSKRGRKLISQPIKGTAKRSENLKEDEQLKKDLSNHPKEQQENVMIVDLVRNDLTKSAKKGTVAVEELFGVYSFKQVHQMISTVVCELKDEITNTEILKNSFPMGSMTGAPKIKAMQLMEHYERSKRGLYSGAIGYFSPEDDFDFNVIIRTILYNEKEKYLSFQVGSAITYYAESEKEYDECLLKVKAILEVLA
jgi:para-aminobenzoate synthetase component 1